MSVYFSIIRSCTYWLQCLGSFFTAQLPFASVALDSLQRFRRGFPAASASLQPLQRTSSAFSWGYGHTSAFARTPYSPPPHPNMARYRRYGLYRRRSQSMKGHLKSFAQIPENGFHSFSQSRRTQRFHSTRILSWGIVVYTFSIPLVVFRVQSEKFTDCGPKMCGMCIFVSRSTLEDARGLVSFKWVILTIFEFFPTSNLD